MACYEKVAGMCHASLPLSMTREETIFMVCYQKAAPDVSC